MSEPKTICFDLDGTLCTNTFGAYEDAVPFPWAIERVNALAEAGHRIIIMTARGSATGIDWDEVTRGQLARWGVRYEELHFGKPSAAVYVDDRAVHTDAWRVSDIARPPGFARPLAAPDEELPAVAPPERSAVVEVARTYGGRLDRAREHAERSLALARAAGVRLLPEAGEVERALHDAVAAAPPLPDGDDLIVTLAHADVTHAALVDTWHPQASGGLHVGVRRLSEAAAGLQRFHAGEGAIVATLEGREGAWPLVDAGDALGGQLAALRDGELIVSPPAGAPTVAGAALAELTAFTERPLTAEDLAEAEELFILALPFCVLPIAELDGRALATTTGAGLLEAWGVAGQTARLVRAHEAVA